jgi:hypothetical protein
MRGRAPLRAALGALLLLAAGPAARADGVSNVTFRQTADDRVEIRYSLDAPAGATYRVELLASEDRGASFTLRPLAVEGDVGEGVEPGPGKVILWDALADVGRLVGEGFVFRVVAAPEPVAASEPPVRLVISKPRRPAAASYVEHEVRQWESLSSIARLYGTSVEAIRRANDLGAHARIRVGMVLRVPLPKKKQGHHAEHH